MHVQKLGGVAVQYLRKCVCRFEVRSPNLVTLGGWILQWIRGEPLPVMYTPVAPSIVARRKHVLGAGLRAEYPFPDWPSIPCGTDQLLTSPPPLSPGQIAGLIRRFHRYAPGYNNLVGRYADTDPFKDFGLPVAYLNGPLNQASEALIGSVYNSGLVSLHSTFPVLGAAYVPPNGVAGGSSIIDRVERDWSLADEFDHAEATSPVPDEWMQLDGGSFVSSNIGYPGGGFDVFIDNTEHRRFYWPANGGTLCVGAFGVPVDRLTQNAYIYAYLYGKIPAPTRWEGQLAQRPHEPGRFAEDYIGVMAATCGRVVWQMVYIEFLLQYDDLFERNLGGRGGKPLDAESFSPVPQKEASLFPVAAGAPVATSPKPFPWNDYLRVMEFLHNTSPSTQ